MIHIRFVYVDPIAAGTGPHADDAAARAQARALLLPQKQTLGSAGFDLVAAVDVELAPGARALVGTGIALALPTGHEGQIRPRSGLALKHGVTCLNAPGTIDSDYRGEIKVLLVNHGQEPHAIRRGDRVAQLVIGVVTPARFVAVDALEDTLRGGGGFGSTGS